VIPHSARFDDSVACSPRRCWRHSGQTPCTSATTVSGMKLATSTVTWAWVKP
jgi:hypothetical protein